MARSVCWRPAGEQRESIVQTTRDLVERQATQAGSRELDRKWDAVESSTHLADERDVLSVKPEGRADSDSTIGEEPNGLGSQRTRTRIADALPAETAIWLLIAERHARGSGELGLSIHDGVWERERRQSPNGLAHDSQRLATGCEHPQVRARPQQVLDDDCDRGGQMLAVVQDQ